MVWPDRRLLCPKATQCPWFCRTSGSPCQSIQLSLFPALPFQATHPFSKHPCIFLVFIYLFTQFPLPWGLFSPLFPVKIPFLLQDGDQVHPPPPPTMCSYTICFLPIVQLHNTSPPLLWLPTHPLILYCTTSSACCGHFWIWSPWQLMVLMFYMMPICILPGAQGNALHVVCPPEMSAELWRV